jgi:hypothetical protein
MTAAAKMTTTKTPTPTPAPAVAELRWSVSVECDESGAVGALATPADGPTLAAIQTARANATAALLARLRTTAQTFDDGPAGDRLRQAKANAEAARRRLAEGEAELKDLQGQAADDATESRIVSLIAILPARRSRAEDAERAAKDAEAQLTKARYDHNRQALAAIRTEAEARQLAAEKRLADSLQHDDLTEYLSAVATAQHAGRDFGVLADSAGIERPPAKPQTPPPLPPAGATPVIYANSPGAVAGFVAADEPAPA